MNTGTLNSREFELQGFCSPKFAGLREAFLKNFQERGEVGASYAVMIGGELVADLWGGSKDLDGTAPWERDDIACVWSVGKGVGAVCVAMLVDRGLCSYDDKVSRYWPEFAAEGKGDVTIGMLMSHQAGITGFTTPATLEDFVSGEAAAKRLAAQPPLWPVGSGAGYSNAVGILATALFQRIEGRSIRQFVHDELKGSFGLDISVGVDPQDRSRVADLLSADTADAVNVVRPSNDAQRALHNPPMRGDTANLPAWQGADIVAANCFTNARALASMYGMLTRPGQAGRRQLVGPAALAGATKVRFDGIDIVRGVRRAWAAGFQLNEENVWGPNKESFGHGGWGGSLGYGDPVADVAVGYVMNVMSDQMDLNPRRLALIEAVYAAL
jgi:CubicO group peptidase (beta-lactamase class C family)